MKTALITLHGELGERVGKEWRLSVSSVSEAIHAINVMTDNKLKKTFWNHDAKNIKYKVLINENPILRVDKLESSEIFLRSKNIKTIDFVPVLEGQFIGSGASIALGAMSLAFAGDSPAAAMAGLSMIFAGLSNMLSKPPERPEQRQIVNPSSDPSQLANSYLFSGPVNVINEGGPVPIGYGRLLVGSQVVQSTYKIERVLTRDAGRQI